MLSIFTIPKSFVGHNSIIQRNAIRSWMQLSPQCEIILFGDDLGVAETAHKLGVKHIPLIEKNLYGTPLLGSAFSKAQEVAKHEMIMYVNADMIIFQDIIEAVMNIDINKYLLCGRRWDMEISHEIDFSSDTWAEELQRRATTESTLHGLSGMDYFIFPRNLVDMPMFAVGRPGWDSWLVYDMRSRGIPVTNATEVITAIHQNHDYSHSIFGEKKKVGGPECKENLRIAGGLTNMLTLRDADWLLTKSGMRRPDIPMVIFSLISLWYPWRLLLAMKRKLQNLVGGN